MVTVKASKKQAYCSRGGEFCRRTGNLNQTGAACNGPISRKKPTVGNEEGLLHGNSRSDALTRVRHAGTQVLLRETAPPEQAQTWGRASDSGRDFCSTRFAMRPPLVHIPPDFRARLQSGFLDSA